MWNGNEGESVDELVEYELKAVVVVPAISESEDEGGSESACALTLSKRERLMNSSSEPMEVLETEKDGG